MPPTLVSDSYLLPGEREREESPIMPSLRSIQVVIILETLLQHIADTSVATSLAAKGAGFNNITGRI